MKGKDMNKKISSVAGLILLLLVGYFIGIAQSRNEVSIERKVYTFPSSDKLSYACEAINSMHTYEMNNYSDDDSVVTLEADINKGTDTVAIEVDEDKFYFLTKASLEIGVVRPDEEWDILTNNNESLIAMVTSSPFENGPTIDIFSLDKNTGIALWSKNRTQGFLTGTVPVGSLIHFKCS